MPSSTSWPTRSRRCWRAAPRSSAAAGSPIDAAIVGSVAVIGAIVGGTQRFQAEQAVQALTLSSDVPVRVRRRGAARPLPSGSLVPGDVIELDAGDLIPADARILGATNLEVDEANLTGESVPVAKSARPVVAANAAERSSMLYRRHHGRRRFGGRRRGGHRPRHRGRCRATERACRLPSRAGVEARLRQLSAITLPFAAAGGAVVVGSGAVRGRSLSETLSAGVSLAVAAIPEGLPVLTTSAQLAAARRLSARGALVRNPPCDRGARPGRRAVHRQDGHAHRGPDRSARRLGRTGNVRPTTP